MILTKEKAEEFAQQQKDIGGKTRDLLAQVLCGELDLDAINASSDPLTFQIAVAIINAEDKNEAETNLSYAIDCLDRAYVSLSNL